jgi:hypothetical protein
MVSLFTDPLYLNAFFRAGEFNRQFASHRQIITNPAQNVRIIRQDLTASNWDRHYVSNELQYGLNWVVLTIPNPTNPSLAFNHHILVEVPKPLHHHQHKILIYDWLPVVFSPPLDYKKQILAKLKVNRLWTKRIFFFEYRDNLARFFREFLPLVDATFRDPSGSTLAGFQEYFRKHHLNQCGIALICAIVHVYFNVAILDFPIIVN